MVPIVLYRQK